MPASEVKTKTEMRQERKAVRGYSVVQRWGVNGKETSA